ncbi:hypothetical protein PGT21_000104 [Puccinia graminis f. sp. tritici]|uniref:Uncharacterized protein n=1 Tax=Puccinia graminis f. sp. tritici TaxID=56615 RepID=A0A5B0PIN3_PUCGR|nr:hypothetical protein PGT21_000104 [Puccinia graminis f. sp. tritici]
MTEALGACMSTSSSASYSHDPSLPSPPAAASISPSHQPLSLARPLLARGAQADSREYILQSQPGHVVRSNMFSQEFGRRLPTNNVSSDLYPVRFPFGQMAQQPNILLILVMQAAQELPPSHCAVHKTDSCRTNSPQLILSPNPSSPLRLSRL